MESLESLRTQLRIAKEELEKITVKKYGTTPWAQGVQDQYKSDSYSYDVYTDVPKANRLKYQIAELEDKINTYAQRAQRERESLEVIRESQIPEYQYTSDGKTHTTTNPAIAARYNAQQRLFGMSKLQRTVASISGQKRKFESLWSKAASQNVEIQEQVAEELNKMFR